MAQARELPQMLTAEKLEQLITKKEWKAIESAVDKDLISKEVLAAGSFGVNAVYCLCSSGQWDIVKNLLSKGLLTAEQINQNTFFYCEYRNALQILYVKNIELFCKIFDLGLFSFYGLTAQYVKYTEVLDIKTNKHVTHAQNATLYQDVMSYDEDEIIEFSKKEFADAVKNKKWQKIIDVMSVACSHLTYAEQTKALHTIWTEGFPNATVTNFMEILEKTIEYACQGTGISPHLAEQEKLHSSLRDHHILLRAKQKLEKSKFDYVDEMIEAIKTKEKEFAEKNPPRILPSIFVGKIENPWTNVLVQLTELTAACLPYQEAKANREQAPENK